jgi:large subunit ribosomal protein L13
MATAPTHTIDASNITIGRVAAKAAALLIGKNEPAMAKNRTQNVKVSVVNAGKSKIAEKKLTSKNYITYSGHPRGIHYRTLSHTIGKKGVSEAIRHAVWGMLPKNTLRSRMILNLTVTE